jgi:hypothetical protein
VIAAMPRVQAITIKHRAVDALLRAALLRAIRCIVGAAIHVLGEQGRAGTRLGDPIHKLGR